MDLKVMVWTLFLAAIWILTIIDDCDAASHQGTDFALGFVENVHSFSSNAVLYISTQDPRGANVTVEIPNAETEFQSAGFPMKFTIAQFETRVVEFPTATIAGSELDIRIMLKDRRKDRGIHIFSDNGVKLEIVGVNDEVASTDAFLALPCKLENEPEANFFTSTYQHFIFSAFPAGNALSYFLIIPCTPGGRLDNSGITYTIPGEDEESIDSLLQYETFLVSSGSDLTGTIVRSPYPLAVLSGHQCGHIPEGIVRCDHLVEQIPPDITYGTKFFVLPFAVRESGDMIRIGSTVSDNEVSITCTRREADNSTRNIFFTETINAGGFVEYRTQERLQEPSADYRRDYCCIETSKPAIVMQYMLASGEDRVTFEDVILVGDPAMTLVPPVEQYSNEYIIVTPDDYAENPYHSYIGWAISAEYFNPQIDFANFLVDDAVFQPNLDEDSDLLVNYATFLPTPYRDGEYIPIYCRDGEVCGYGGVRRIEAGVRQVSYRPPSQEDASMYVSVYGFGREISYAYPAGMRCDPIGLPHISTYDVFVLEGVNPFAEVKFNRTGGNLAVRSRVIASTVEDSEGRAMGGSDFIAVRLTRIFFEVDSVDALPLYVAILDDTIAEETESFDLHFFIDSQDSSGGYASPSNVAHVTIFDNDGEFKCSFLETDYTVLESAAKVVIKILTNDVSLRNACVLTTQDGTALAGFDYVEYDGAVEFLDVVKCIEITITDDITEELNESFRIRLLSRTSNNIFITSLDVATVHILNDDIVFFHFSMLSTVVSETESSISLTIMKRGSADHDVTITFATSSITATEADYVATFMDVTFQADEENITVLVPIKDDDVFEFEEEFGASLTRFVDGHQRTLSMATIHIESDEIAVVGFEFPSYTVQEEGDGHVNICVVLNTTARSLEDNISVDIVTQEVTAGSDDFRRLSDIITFRQSDRKSCIGILIIDDPVDEGVETFNVLLPIPFNTRLIIGTYVAEVIIVDNDEFHAGGGGNRLPVIVECFPRFGCVGTPVFTTMSDCCRHASSPFGVSYTDLNISQCIQCPVEFGFLQPTIEEQESGTPYKVQIGFLSGSSESGGVRVRVFFITGTATENDVTISSTEEASNFFGVPALEINVLEVSDQYHATTLELLFKEDNIAMEGNEIFSLGFTFDPEAFDENVTLRNTLDGTIIDADTVAFQWSASSYSAVESEEAIAVTIEKVSDVSLANPVEFTVSTLTVNDALMRNEIATFDPLNSFALNRAGSSEFLNSSIEIIFPADEGSVPTISHTIDISIFNDDVNEATEFFVVHLEANSDIGSVLVIGEKSSSICKIIDDDILQIEFEEDRYQLFEPDTISLFNLSLIKKNNRQTEQTFGIIVSFGDPGRGLRPATLLQNENGTINPDYMVDIPETITFRPDESRVTISFMLLPDEVIEGSEGFAASIKSRGDPYPDFELPISLAKTLVVVQDNDYIFVGFEWPSYTVDESESTVVICVQLNNTQMLNFSVALFYYTERETADGFDFEEIPGAARQLLIISAEDILSCIDITIKDDIIVEETESFTLKLEVARDSDRDSVRFVNQIAEIAIKDNDESVNDHSIVSCFPTMNCDDTTTEAKNATLFDCCRHGVQPFGLSFIIPDQDGCQLCPIEFGFLEREFTGMERLEEYTANLTFISGNIRLGDGFVVNVTLYPDDSNDVMLTTPEVLITRIYPSDDLQLFPVSFICKEDRVAQEVNETFTLTIQFNPIFLGATSASTLRNTFIGSIQDSNYVTFQLSQSEYKEFENREVMSVEVTKFSNVTLASSVSFMILPLTIDEALSRDMISEDMISSFEESAPQILNSFSPYRADFLDFDNSSISLQFPAGEGLVNVDVAIPIVDDDINEADLQVFVAYLMVENAVNENQIVFNRQTSNCVIIDNDSIRIGFQRSSYALLEPDDAKASFDNITLIKENGRVSEQTFGVEITFSEPGPGTNVATLQDVGQVIEFDFVISSPGNDTITLYFYPNQSEINFSFCVVPDDLVEGTEGFRAFITSLGAPFPDFQLPQSTSSAAPAFRDTMIKIFDRSDFAVLGFEELFYNVSEADEGVEICVIVTNPPPSENLTLNIALEYKTTRVSASGDDFREHRGGLSAKFISFRMSDLLREKCFDIVVFQDLIYENTEHFLLSLTPVEGADSIIIEPQSTEVFIDDDDELFIGISENQLLQVEQDVFEFNLFRNQRTEVSIFLVVHIMDIVNQSNLSAILREINATRQNISISWGNDDIFELDESILVQLSFLGSPPPRVNITTENVTVTIVDDDSLRFFYAPSEVFTVEGTEDFVNLTIMMDGCPGNLSIYLVLSINDTSSTASAGGDFDFSSIELEFSSLVVAHNISIGIIDDDLNEFEEHFEVIVSDVLILDAFGDEIEISNDERSRILTNETATIIIRDRVQFRFAENSYVVNEGAGMITLQVIKEGFATEESSVQFSTEDGSASSTNDTDFVEQSRNLTFSVNQNEASVNIEITDDDILEGNETFLAILSEVSEDGDVVVLANVTVIIQDNIATITIISFPDPDDIVPTFGAPAFPPPMPDSQVLEVSLGVIFGIVALLTLIVVVLVILYLLYRRKHVKQKQISLSETERSNEYVRGLRHFTVQTSYKVDIPHSLFIVSCNLKLGATLGQGEFGVVYKGYLKSGISDAIRDTVAVKTLKGFVQKELVRDLLKECGRMYKFDHPNVLKLLGVCMDGGPAPFIIMPYMANGSLLAYLKKEREDLLLNPETAMPEDAEMVEKKLLDMCIQVAKGMEYLASKRVIHRDLAARNCMIDVNFVIKVADFGLAESMDSSKDYFRQNQEDSIKLPMKWLSLESIHDRVFSEKSDVWSYGVTCWEVFNGGKTPYPGIHPADLARHLDIGLRLEKPVNAACTEEIYSFMLKCWDAEAHLRPTFAALVEQLSEMLGVMAGYLDFSAPDHTAETKV